MISFTSILATINGASLTAKGGLSVGVVAVVAGGTAGTVAIINANKTHEETQIVADNSDDDNSPSEQKDTQIGEAGEPEDDNNKSEQAGEDNKPTTNNPQTTTQKPNNSSASNNQSNNSSSSKPSTPTTQPSQPSQPSAPTQPSQPTQSTKKSDYNLNDKYVVGSNTYAFYTYDDSTSQCSLAEEKSFFGIAKFAGTSNDLWSGSHSSQYATYAKSKGYDTAHCGGMGAAMMSWEEAVSQGIALDEAKCSQYGLNCGRW